MLVEGAHTFVMGAVVIFSIVIAQIFLAWMMADGQNALCFLTQQPKISHVHRPRALAFDGVVDDPDGGGVVAMDGDGGLGMPHLLKGEFHYFCFHCVEEEGAQLCFRGGCGDAFEDGGEGEDGAVEANGASVLGEGAKEKMSPGAAARAGGREVGGVGVDV